MKYFLILFAAGFLALSGCEQKGPAETLGENIDEGLDEVGDFLDDAADTVVDEAQRARANLEEAVDNP